MLARTSKRVQVVLLALIGVPISLLALGTQCPPPPEEPPLTVDVTADQTSGDPPLAILATATPAGGVPPYTFQWSSAPGGLIGAPTAQSTNVTFAIAGNYTVTCTVTDSAGQTATDSVPINVGTPPPAVTPTLFVANRGAPRVLSWQNPATVNGNIAPDTNISGSAAQLTFPFHLVVNSANELIVSDSLPPGTAKLLVYNDAAAANGNLAPARNVNGAATQLSFPRGLAYDEGRDILYVANAGANSIAVFANASTATFNGNLAPTRIFTGGLASPQGISLDQGGANLYVANLATNQITVYASPFNLNGPVSPTRAINGSPGFTGLFDVFVDAANDRLYAVNATAPLRINMFLNAQTRNGTVAPDTTLVVTGAISLDSIVVDSADRGYISDVAGSRIFSYDNVSTRNGTLTPDRTISGTNTQLAGPSGMFILE